MRFDLLDLQLLAAVHDHGTLAAAARAVHLSRAAAGERVRALERRAGAVLFARVDGRLAATEAGEALLRPARRALADVDAMAADLAARRRGAERCLHVLCNTAAGREVLPQALARFLPSRPDVAVRLDERPSDAIVRAIADGEGTLGVVSDAVDRAGLCEAELRPDPLVLVVRAGHRLAGRAMVGLQEALAEPFVGLPAGNALQSLVDREAARLGGALGYRLRLDGLDAVCTLAAAGVGLAVVPLTAARRLPATAGACVAPLRDAWARRRLLLVAPSFAALAPAAARLVAHLRDPGLSVAR